MSKPPCGEVLRGGEVPRVCTETAGTEHTHDLAVCTTRLLDPYEFTYRHSHSEVEFVETAVD